MISFMEFLLEEKKETFLLQSFEVAKTYFEKNASSLVDAKLKMSDIEKIYQYVEKNQNSIPKNKPEPIVADYQGVAGAFAFRRWVSKVFSSLKPNGKFKGFHDTKISKDTNTVDTWKPSAQDMESVICLACNNINDQLSDKQKQTLLNAEKKLTAIKEGEITEDEIANSEKANIFYLKHKEELDAVAQTLSDRFKNVQFNPMDKLATNDEVSDIWKKDGNYAISKSRPNRTPKTDIISKDGKIKVSVKQGDKGAQLMSGYQAEATATLKAAIKKVHGEKKYKRILNILDNPDFKFIKLSLKDLTQDEIKAQQAAGKDKIAELNQLIKDACESDRDLKYALMYEAATGDIKFGKDAASTANAILVWSIDNPKLNYADDIISYIDHIIDKTKIFIAFKTSSSSSVQALRIQTPKQTAK